MTYYRLRDCGVQQSADRWVRLLAARIDTIGVSSNDELERRFHDEHGVDTFGLIRPVDEQQGHLLVELNPPYLCSDKRRYIRHMAIMPDLGCDRDRHIPDGYRSTTVRRSTSGQSVGGESS